MSLKSYPFCYWQTANRGSQRSRYAADMRFLGMRYKKHTRFRICSQAIISYVP